MKLELSFYALEDPYTDDPTPITVATPTGHAEHILPPETNLALGRPDGARELTVCIIDKVADSLRA